LAATPHIAVGASSQQTYNIKKKERTKPETIVKVAVVHPEWSEAELRGVPTCLQRSVSRIPTNVLKRSLEIAEGVAGDRQESHAMAMDSYMKTPLRR